MKFHLSKIRQYISEDEKNEDDRDDEENVQGPGYHGVPSVERTRETGGGESRDDDEAHNEVEASRRGEAAAGRMDAVEERSVALRAGTSRGSA